MQAELPLLKDIRFDAVSDINIMFEREAPNTERGSPSLVGRGIAKRRNKPVPRTYTILPCKFPYEI
jgi:hypothetical protein